ncbi:WRKY transcription factor 44-like protein [Cinnamomum micranthum f. kanehirae]|uniref:WRKY transcription factor 44-like protein n=1 Tax=Cinnamomum micranthum f. kanehirae TaxID=337451 RepID=A0A3S3MKK2_9MAGN|nr:WRKY transcription factor 44-like protein [Cinnamomum micranthum f. kanehirae]
MNWSCVRIGPVVLLRETGGELFREGKIGPSEEQAEPKKIGSGANQLIPEDGHSWKKYGQKFIKHTKGNRSYFKCQKTKCRAKKTVDWCSSDPSYLRVIYQGRHDHPSSGPHSSSTVNQYNLVSQVFGP